MIVTKKHELLIITLALSKWRHSFGLQTPYPEYLILWYIWVAPPPSLATATEPTGWTEPSSWTKEKAWITLSFAQDLNFEWCDRNNVWKFSRCINFCIQFFAFWVIEIEEISVFLCHLLDKCDLLDSCVAVHLFFNSSTVEVEVGLRSKMLNFVNPVIKITRITTVCAEKSIQCWQGMVIGYFANGLR